MHVNRKREQEKSHKVPFLRGIFRFATETSLVWVPVESNHTFGVIAGLVPAIPMRVALRCLGNRMASQLGLARVAQLTGGASRVNPTCADKPGHDPACIVRFTNPTACLGQNCTVEDADRS